MKRRKPVIHRTILRTNEFKEKFKPGDIIEGYSTNKLVRITAIGIDRFLYIDPEHGKSYYKYIERVSIIENPQAMWREPSLENKKLVEFYED